MKKLIIIALACITAACIPSSCLAQKDPVAVQSALAILIHKHSVNADTIAVELSEKFRKSAAMQTAIAKAYYRNNERAKTRFYLGKAIAADAKYVPAYILHGDMYGEWNVDSAAYWFDRAIEANPEDSEGYVRYANVMARSNLDKAKAKLEALRLAVPSYNVNVELAALYNKLNDDKMAVSAMANVDLNSLSVSQLAQYLQNCYWANDDVKGMEVGALAIKKYPSKRDFSRVYAWCAARSGFYKEAIEQGEKWFEAAPVDSLNSIDFLTMGNAQLGEGHTDKAFDYWERIKYLKDDYFAPQMKGQITRTVNRQVETLKGEGDFIAAADIYERFIKAYPSDTDPAYQLYSLSQIYRDYQEKLSGEEQLECIRRMFAIYSEIEEKYPKWENIHFVLYTHARWTYSFFDRENEQCLAEPYYQKLYDYLLTKPELNDQQHKMMAEACQYMGSTAYFQHQDVRTARQWWTRVLKYDPENTNAKQALETIKK